MEKIQAFQSVAMAEALFPAQCQTNCHLELARWKRAKEGPRVTQQYHCGIGKERCPRPNEQRTKKMPGNISGSGRWAHLGKFNQPEAARQGWLLGGAGLHGLRFMV